MRGTPYIGRRYPRVEDGALVRGAGRFVDDLNPPGLLEVAFLRSPAAHGLIGELLPVASSFVANTSGPDSLHEVW
jgi:CO/xanthine dehydrogenase Mo-binding subunit